MPCHDTLPHNNFIDTILITFILPASHFSYLPFIHLFHQLQVIPLKKSRKCANSTKFCTTLHSKSRAPSELAHAFWQLWKYTFFTITRAHKVLADLSLFPTPSHQTDRATLIMQRIYSFILQDALQGFYWGKQSINSSSFCSLYQDLTPVNIVLCLILATLMIIHYHFIHFKLHYYNICAQHFLT